MRASIDRQISMREPDSGEALAICAAREHPAGTCVEDATIYPRASDAPPPSAAGAVRADQSAWHTRHMRRMRMLPARAVVRPHAHADDAVLTRARAVCSCAARIFL